MISKKLNEALNKQINAEMYSSYMYLAMSAWCESEFLGGFADWLRVQSQEEWGHAMKIYDYVQERSGEIKLFEIAPTKTQWQSAAQVFDVVYRHEQKVTGLIHDLVALAAAEKDPAAGVFLNWFVTEQVEEEASAEKAVALLKMVGDSKNGLLMLDHQMGKRKSGS